MEKRYDMWKWKLKDNKKLQSVIKNKNQLKFINMTDIQRYAYLTTIIKKANGYVTDNVLWAEAELRKIENRKKQNIRDKNNYGEWWEQEPNQDIKTEAGYVYIDVRIDKEWFQNHTYTSFGSHNSRYQKHRYVWEKANNQYCEIGSTVHHKNGKRDDNQSSNLEYWSGSHLHGVREADMVEWSMNRIGAEKAKSWFHSKGVVGYIMSRIMDYYLHTEKSKEIIADVLMEFFNIPKELAIESAEYMQKSSKEFEEKTKYDTLMSDLKTPAPKNKFNKQILGDIYD